MRELKRLFSGLLVMAMVITSVPMGQVKASDAVDVQEQKADTVKESASQIQSIVWEDVEVIEGVDGSEQEWINPSTGETETWFKYDVQVKVTLEDGRNVPTYRDPYGITYLYIDGTEYRVCMESDQSGENPWEVGTHEVCAYIDGFENSRGVFNVNVVGVDRIEVDAIKLIENVNGSEVLTGPGDSNGYFKYSYSPRIKVILNDGRELIVYCYDAPGGMTGYFYYNNKCHYVYFQDGQSEETPWGVGKHIVTGEGFGKEVSFEVEVIENPAVRIEIEPVQVKENINGSEVLSESGNSNGYFKYSYSPKFKVILKNGEVLESTNSGPTSGSIVYEGQWYSLNFQDDQSEETPWGVGKHMVTGEVFGKECSFEVEVIESPVEKIEIDSVRVIENINGREVLPGPSDTNGYFKYSYSPNFRVILKNGDVLKGQSYSGPDGSTGSSYVWYENQSYNLNFQDDQSSATPWGVGKHTVTGKIFGKQVSFEVEVVENPIESIVAQDISIPAYTSGYYYEGYSPGIGQYQEYYRYSYQPKFTVTYKNGDVKENVSSLTIEGQTFYPSLNMDDQSGENPWKEGVHEVTGTFLGKEFSFNVEITKSPFVSLEVLKVNPIIENTNCRFDENGNAIYNIPTFSFKAVCEDGTVEYGIYDSEEELKVWSELGFKIVDTQSEKPWKVGSDNSFKIEAVGLEIEVPVEVRAGSKYTYVEQNGGIYITSCQDTSEIIEIPSQIDGKPVVGIVSLGDALTWAYKVVIPDSVKSIGAEAFQCYPSNLQILEIGSGVNYLDADMFGGSWNLTEITISKDNPYYCAVDNVVYDKNMTKVVVYPLGRGYEYVVPATVTDISVVIAIGMVDITFEEGSTAYVTEDGVTYTVDKKKVIYCNPSKTGSYEMPNTVTEIAEGAFWESSLKEIKISNKVTEIAYGTFMMSALENVELPASLKTIGQKAFFACSNLQDVNFPEGLETIGDASFSSTDIKELIIPDSVKKIEEGAFCYTNIEELVLGKNLKEIGNRAFYNIPIQELVIPDSVTKIGVDAFARNEMLSKVVIGKGVQELKDDVFFDCWKLKEVVLKNENVSLGNNAFMGCPIETINMENVKGRVGECALSGTELKKVTFAEGVTRIAYSAMIGSEKLETIELPDSLESLGGYAFDYTPWDEAQKEGPVYLEQVFYKYKGEMPEDTEFVVKEGTTILADYAFEYQDGLTSVTLPKGLKTIGRAAFNSASNLKEITIPASVSNIGESAFFGCDSLESINVDSANEHFSSVDGVLFSKDGTELIWCPKRVGDTYEVPSTVKVIKRGAFATSGVENVVIRNNDIKLEEYSIGCEYMTKEETHDYEWSSKGAYQGITIHCFEGSTAEAYAEANFLPTNIMEYKPITKVELDATSLAMKVGETATLKATISPADTTIDTTLTWTSSNSNVVSCENGVLKALKIGSATITVKTSNGKTATCVVAVSGEAKWEKDQNGWWFVREDGSYPTNQWYEIGGEWYYFNAAGYRVENQWVGAYYVNGDGVMVKNQWVGAYYIGADGQYISSSKWLEIDGKWYYLGHGGARSTGWQSVGGAWYYFDAKGVMATGEKTIGGTEYYFFGSGAMATGWQAIDGDWYYYAGSGAMVKGWQAIGGVWYYFGSEGAMITGAKTIGGTEYYFLPSGAMATGWQAIDGDWYYYAGSGAMCKDWQIIGGTWYYFGATGVMETGKKTIGNAEYYFLSSGAMATGWQVIGGDWYYIAGSGAIVKNQWVGNYYMLEDGVMATNKWIGNYYVGADGAWQPNAKK